MPVPVVDEVSPAEPPATGSVPAGGDGWMSVGVGTAHSCALTVAGEAYCWGSSRTAQTGTADPPDLCGPPAVGCARRPVRVQTTVRFVSLSSGGAHNCALDASGTAYCWGDNLSGQLGTPSPRQASEPVPVSGGHRFRQIAAGELHTCAVRIDGAVLCWGQNENGELGRGQAAASATPIVVTGGRTYAGVTAGSGRSCAWTTAGEVYCWGRIWLYTSEGLEWSRRQLIPIAVAEQHALRALSVGLLSTCGLRANGTAACWEANGFGQLGTGAISGSTEPLDVSGAREYRAVSVGSIQTCAIAADYRAWCWGNNSFGQLGNHTIRSACALAGLACTRVPVPVLGELRFVSLATGLGNHTCGVTTLTNLYCWGLGVNGQLGDGDERTVVRLEATKVSR